MKSSMEEVPLYMVLEKRMMVLWWQITPIGEIFNKHTSMAKQHKREIWRQTKLTKIRNMKIFHLISLDRRRKIISLLMIQTLRKLDSVPMQTGQLKVDQPRSLTKVTSKIHTKRNKPNYHHKCLIKQITQSISQWTSLS
jgi:ABC-type lipoprotein release transport system permease subunit